MTLTFKHFLSAFLDIHNIHTNLFLLYDTYWLVFLNKQSHSRNPRMTRGCVLMNAEFVHLGGIFVSSSLPEFPEIPVSVLRAEVQYTQWNTQPCLEF